MNICFPKEILSLEGKPYKVTVDLTDGNITYSSTLYTAPDISMLEYSIHEYIQESTRVQEEEISSKHVYPILMSYILIYTLFQFHLTPFKDKVNPNSKIQNTIDAQLLICSKIKYEKKWRLKEREEEGPRW